MPKFQSNTIQAHIAKIDKKGAIKFLVLQRSLDKLPYPGLWQVVTGKIDKDETALNAAIREVKEETGLDPVNVWTLPYVSIYFNAVKDKIQSSPVFGFLVKNDVDVVISKEHQAFKWLSYSQSLKFLLLPSHKKGMKIFLDYVLKKPDKIMFKVI